MPRFTSRDSAVIAVFVVLGAATAVLAVLDLTRWALAGVGVLVAVAAIVAHLQFAARRATYEVLRREARENVTATRRILRQNTKILALNARIVRQNTKVLGQSERSLRGAKTIRIAAQDAAESAAAVRQELASGPAGITDMHAEVRGIRISQQLSSLNLVALRREVGESATQLSRLSSEQELGLALLREEGAAHHHAFMERADALAQHVDLAWVQARERDELRATDAVREREESRERVATDIAAAFAAQDEKLATLAQASGPAAVAAKVRPAIESLEWQIRRQRAELITDFQAMEQLLRRFRPDAALPPVAGWAMSPAGLLMLTETVTKHGAELVVECGSGSSTLWLALAMREQGRGKVVALEHLQEFADRTQEVLDAHGVGEWAEVRVAPLTTVATPQGEFQWYDTTGVTWDRPIDVLLVDGPPTTTGPHARYPALSVLGAELRPGATIILDDTDRVDEREVYSLWQEEKSDLIHRTSPGVGIDVFSFGTPES